MGANTTNVSCITGDDFSNLFPDCDKALSTFVPVDNGDGTTTITHTDGDGGTSTVTVSNTDINLYTTNGTLTGNRDVSLDGNTLAFNNGNTVFDSGTPNDSGFFIKQITDTTPTECGISVGLDPTSGKVSPKKTSDIFDQILFDGGTYSVANFGGVFIPIGGQFTQTYDCDANVHMNHTLEVSLNNPAASNGFLDVYLHNITTGIKHRFTASDIIRENSELDGTGGNHQYFSGNSSFMEVAGSYTYEWEVQVTGIIDVIVEHNKSSSIIVYK